MLTVASDELTTLMIKNRVIPLIAISLCLLGSHAVLSDENPFLTQVDSAPADPVQLVMLTEDKETAELDEVAPVEMVPETKTETEHESQNIETEVADKTSARQLDDEELAKLRSLFLQAEVALDKHDNARYLLLAGQLESYPLYPYLQYRWLKKNLRLERQVKYFLEQYASSRYATMLHTSWLYYLAKYGKWQKLLANYRDTSDASMNCYYRRAQYKSGDRQAALEGARKLWAVGKSQPKACDPLFAQLKKSELFDDELLWIRFEAAMLNNKTRLARYVKKLMPVSEQKMAGLWLKLHNQPVRYLPVLMDRTQNEHASAMFVHAINRLASRDIQQAIEIWDTNNELLDIDERMANKLERRLAFKLVYENEPGAYERLGHLQDTDYNSKAWRIRIALNEQEWPCVIDAIKDLDVAKQNTEKWQYWLARAYEETGKPLQAEELFSDLSGKRDFYGYLAADRLNRIYKLSDNPINVTLQHIAEVSSRKEFQVAFELMVLERDREAKLQWWHALRQLDKQDIPAAAKLAQKWQWDEIAIFTIAKVKYWDDIELRFPLSYFDEIHENAIEQGLNPVILYGLIRRESAFNKDARSPVGARGLMQLMPRTARQVARELDERWMGKNSLFDPIKNLKYGSYYYQQLLSRFGGNYAIALAAYNAGPNRVSMWLPDESTPADIWIENIPYRETRDYVTSVLAYAMIYQQRIQSDELTMDDLTRDVVPLLDIAMNQE